MIVYLSYEISILHMQNKAFEFHITNCGYNLKIDGQRCEATLK